MNEIKLYFVLLEPGLSRDPKPGKTEKPIMTSRRHHGVIFKVVDAINFILLISVSNTSS